MRKAAPYAATATLAAALAILPLHATDYQQFEWASVGLYACAILGLNPETLPDGDGDPHPPIQ